MQLIHPAIARARGLNAVPNPQQQRAATADIRLAWADDGPALARLAQLDSAPAAAAELPTLAAAGEVLVATAGDRVVAALSLRDGLLISDPFRRTDDVLALLHLRRRQLGRAERPTGLRRLGRLRPRHT